MEEDTQLLEQFVRDGDEPAFRELVNRHIGLVQATARRVLAGDAHAAQDVTQLVFTDLARKAAALPTGVRLGGWLHQHAYFLACNIVRAETRRRARERTAMEINAVNDVPNSEIYWQQLAPILDEALHDLDCEDREAIVLRYLQQQDVRRVGQALGIAENTAQKRLGRALEKLRIILIRRGAPVSAVMLATALDAETVLIVPAPVAATVSAAALTGAASIAGFTSTSLLTMSSSKTLLALAGIAALALLPTVIVIKNKSPDTAKISPATGTTPAANPTNKSPDITAGKLATPAPSSTAAASAAPVATITANPAASAGLVAHSMPPVTTAAATAKATTRANNRDTVAGASQGLHFAAGPADGAETIRTYLSGSSSAMIRSTLGSLDLSSLDIKPPMAIYSMGVSAIASGGGLETAQANGAYRYYIATSGNIVAASDIRNGPSSRPGMNTGNPVFDGIKRALDQMPGLDQVNAGSYEARIIMLPGIFGSGASTLLWLKSDTSSPDLIYIPAQSFVPAGLQAEKAYPADEFFKLAQPIAQKRMEANQGPRSAIPAP